MIFGPEGIDPVFGVWLWVRNFFLQLNKVCIDLSNLNQIHSSPFAILMAI